MRALDANKLCEHRVEDDGHVALQACFETLNECLSDNEAACFRLVSKNAALLFQDRATLHLSQPVAHAMFAARWAAPDSCNNLTRRQRDQLVSLTAKSGDVTNLEVALSASGTSPNEHHLEGAVVGGSARCFVFLARRLAGPSAMGSWGRILRIAAGARQKPICQRILLRCARTGTPLTSEELHKAAQAAAEKGDGGLAEWLLAAAVLYDKAPTKMVELEDLDEQPDEREVKFLSLVDETVAAAAWPRVLKPGQPTWRETFLLMEVCFAALKGCDLETVQRLASKAARGRELWAQGGHLAHGLDAALCSRTPDWAAKVAWLRSLGAQLEPQAAYTSARSLPGALAVERFVWLKAQGCAPLPGDEKLARWLALMGNAPGLAWVLAEGVQADLEVLQKGPGGLEGACGGPGVRATDADIIATAQVLQTAGGVIDWKALALSAAVKGRAGVLSRALEEAEAAEWLTPALFTAAASSGSVEVMRVLRLRGCAVSRDAWGAAAASGCVAAVQLLASWDCPKPGDGAPYLAGLTGGLPALQALRAAGLAFPASDTLPSARRLVLGPDAASQLPILQWLAVEGWPLDWRCLEVFVQRLHDRDEQLVAWVQEQRRLRDQT